MTEPSKILVLHPMAIGDVVLGTPVAAALKRSYPNARIIYFTHPSLFPLLRLCHSIDECIDWTRKAPLLSQLSIIKRARPDLIVDLTSSTRTRLLCLLSGIKHMRYRKQAKDERPVDHVSTRYMQTLSSVNAELLKEQNLFPTLAPDDDTVKSVKNSLEKNNFKCDQPLIALVPGVGSLRPNRAWPEEYWKTLAQNLTDANTAQLALVGGPDDEQLCLRIEQAISKPSLINFAGKLSLPETAALLNLATLVVSGDTGPCHIAVGVGTPVISMMGPTLPQRSGPYGNSALGFDACSDCRCTTAKSCLVPGFDGAGACMEKLGVELVLRKVLAVMETRTAAAGQRTL